MDKKDGIKTYIRAIKMYEEIANKTQTDFSEVFCNVINNVISPRLNKCDSFIDNVKASTQLYPLFREYYGKTWLASWIKFSLKLCLLKKIGFEEQLQ